ncbi:MAG TPA: hypothetical protein VF013_06070 [Candidatus Limnocylindria bacterium]
MPNRPHPRLGAVPWGALLLVAALLPACASTTTSTATPTPSSEPSASAPSASPTEPVATPTATPLSTASGTPAADGPVIATFRVGETEQYRILLTDPADIAIAEALLAGQEAPRIPNGLVVRDGDGGVNTGWSWHIDPADIDFADGTTEVCDGLPSDVERAMISGDRFCPWSAEIVAIEPAG